MEKLFDIDGVGDVIVLSFREGLRADTGAMLKDAVKELGHGRILKLVLDMEKMPSMDSSGCGTLFASLKEALTRGGDLRIARPNQKVLALLKLTRLDRIFEIYQDLDEAIKSFSGAPVK